MALKPRVRVLPSPPETPARPAPPDPQAPTAELPFSEEPVPEAPAVPEGKRKRGRKPKAKAAKPPKARKAAKTPEAGAPSRNGRRPGMSPRNTVNWNETPYAVVALSAKQVCGAFATQQEALDYIGTLSIRHQRSAFVGFFKPVAVKVETTVTVTLE